MEEIKEIKLKELTAGARPINAASRKEILMGIGNETDLKYLLVDETLDSRSKAFAKAKELLEPNIARMESVTMRIEMYKKEDCSSAFIKNGKLSMPKGRSWHQAGTDMFDIKGKGEKTLMKAYDDLLAWMSEDRGTKLIAPASVGTYPPGFSLYAVYNFKNGGAPKITGIHLRYLTKIGCVKRYDLATLKDLASFFVDFACDEDGNVLYEKIRYDWFKEGYPVFGTNETCTKAVQAVLEAHNINSHAINCNIVHGSRKLLTVAEIKKRMAKRVKSGLDKSDQYGQKIYKLLIK